MKKPESITQAEVIEGAPLRYAPENELGVVFLFAHLAKKWCLRVDKVRAGFPDCIAYQKIKGKERQIRIEFEFKSKNFKTHGHAASKCDWIVCWEHNWPDVPANLQVIELRREFGLGFNVWIMPVNSPYKEELERYDSFDKWSLPSQCHKGDLILYYFTKPEQFIRNIFIAMDRAKWVKAEWRDGNDNMAPIRRLCSLKAPIFIEDLHRHRVLSSAHFVRNKMQGRPNATEYWPYLYELIVKKNPSIKPKLQKYAPESI